MNKSSMLLPKLSINDCDKLCQQYLNILYNDVKSNSVWRQEISETYGEILYPSVSKLLSAISPCEHDVFYDLGSGLGKLALQVFLQTNIKKVVGIEILPELHQQAELARQKVENDIPFLFDGREFEFKLGSFFEIPLTDATMVLIGSPCYTMQMFHQLADIIDRSESIRTVISMRPLLSMNRLKFKRTVRIEGSWDSALCYVYRV